MTIDLERLAVDADYWDEVAPEGASHLIDKDKFVKWVDNVEWEFYAFSDRVWKKAFFDWSLQDYINGGDGCVTAKPAAPKSHPTDTQPAQSGAQISAEWDGEGLPPVGTECEAVHFNSWAHVKIVAHVRAIDGTKAVFQLVGFHEWNAYGLPSKFRPTRSQAERERESIIKLALERLGYDPSEFAGKEKPVKGDHAVWDSLNDLYDLGMLRMPDEDVAKNARGES
jgi:hypothetical protein